MFGSVGKAPKCFRQTVFRGLIAARAVYYHGAHSQHVPDASAIETGKKK